MKAVSVVQVATATFKRGTRVFVRPKFAACIYESKARVKDGVVTFRRVHVSEPCWSHGKATREAMEIATKERIPFLPEVKHGSPVPDLPDGA